MDGIFTVHYLTCSIIILGWSLRPLGNVLQRPGIRLKSVQPSDFGGKLKESGEGRVYTRTLSHLNLRENVQHIPWMLLGRPFPLTLFLRIVLTRGNCSGQQRNFCLWRRSYASLIILTKLSSSTTLLIFLWVRSIQFAQTLMLWAYRAWKKVPEDFEIGPQKVLSFKPLTKIAIRKLIQSSAKKSCALDLMPTPLVVSCLDVLLPVITTIVNSSLLHGHFPSNWKETIVTLILKNPSLTSEFSNIRPISNLQFISKLTEHAVFDQLQTHMLDHILYPLLQSAYRKSHSTETALIKVQNDILMNMDRQQVTLLVLLDLSAAFDTITIKYY